MDLTPERMATIKRSTNNKLWWGCREKAIALHGWWECKLIEPMWKSVRRYIKKLKIEVPFDTAIPLLSIFPKELKTSYHSDVCVPVSIAAQFRSVRSWNQPIYRITDERVKKSDSMKTLNTPMIASRLGRKADHGWKYSVWNYNDGYM